MPSVVCERASVSFFLSFVLCFQSRNGGSRYKGMPTFPVVDVLSIGSEYRTGRTAQRKTWATHPSVRYFFGATELDDSPCLDQINVSRVCRAPDARDSWVMRRWRHSFASARWLAPKGGRAWLCAQRRWVESFGKAGEFYGKTSDLPDHLLVVDDDTWYGMEHFSRLVSGVPPELPRALAGCVIMSPQVPHPWGGFGVTVSKGLLSRMIRPLACGEVASAFEQRACTLLHRNYVHEMEHFRPGMSIAALMLAIARARKPMCLHSDWAIGYFINVSLDDDRQLESSWGIQETPRPGGRQGAPLYGNCSGACSGTSLACHNQGAEDMQRMFHSQSPSAATRQVSQASDEPPNVLRAWFLAERARASSRPAVLGRVLRVRPKASAAQTPQMASSSTLAHDCTKAGYPELAKQVGGLLKVRDFVRRQRGLFKERRARLLCMVYTHSGRHDNVLAIHRTWGKRCDGFMAASNASLPALNIIQLQQQGPDTYDNMWQKVRSMWKYVHAHLLDSFDFFHISGDDTYVVVDNMRTYLSPLVGEKKPLYLGAPMPIQMRALPWEVRAGIPQPAWKNFTIEGAERQEGSVDSARKRQFVVNKNANGTGFMLPCAGGPGYTLNRAALSELHAALPSCWPRLQGPEEDIYVAQCLWMRGIRSGCSDSRDEAGAWRYHQQGAEGGTFQRNPLDAIFHIRGKDGLQSVSGQSVAFHLKSLHPKKSPSNSLSQRRPPKAFHIHEVPNSSVMPRRMEQYHELIYGECTHPNGKGHHTKRNRSGVHNTTQEHFHSSPILRYSFDKTVPI